MKANKLKKAPLVPSTERPVASALPLPMDPLPPLSERLPSTIAVNGEPERRVAPPLSCQPCSHLLVAIRLVWALNGVYVQFVRRLWGRLKVDTARSAARL